MKYLTGDMVKDTGNHMRWSTLFRIADFAGIRGVLLLTLLLITFRSGQCQPSDSSAKALRFAGYVRDLPYLQFVENEKTTFDNILNVRLNFSLDLSPSTRVVLEMRNRLIAGETAWGSEPVVSAFRDEQGLIRLGTAFRFVGDNSLVHLTADRFYLEHNRGKWQVRAGRQRINWGINMVSNPNDLFNTYSFFDIDHAERPGSDALRVQYYANELSHAELAFAPARHISDAVAAFLYGINYGKYDIQFIGGYYRNRAAIGLGWAGHLGGAGFKGEATFFSDLDGSEETSLVASVSVDHLLQNGLFVFAEGLYNGGYQDAGGSGFDLSRPLSADNIMFSKFAATISGVYPFSPVVNGSLAIMILPDIRSYFISPSVGYSILEDLEVTLMSQLFGGGFNSGKQQLAVGLIGSIQWSF